MKSVYRIAEGYGNPELPETLFGVQFLPITFSNYDHAVNFAWNHYHQTTTNNPEWQSYFSTVTTETTIAEVLAEMVRELQGI
jgi:hypothetical protein